MMKRLAFLCAAALSLAACVPTALDPPPPVSVADRVVLDERVAIAIELAYQAANKGAQLAIRTGTVRDPATLRRIGELDRRAYAAVQAARAAYRAGNAANYATAINEARSAVTAILSAF